MDSIKDKGISSLDGFGLPAVCGPSINAIPSTRNSVYAWAFNNCVQSFVSITNKKWEEVVHHRKLSDVVKNQNVLYVNSTSNVVTATRQMVERNVAALLIIDEGVLKGIFTERDALRRIIAVERDPAKTRISEVMTTEIITLPGERLSFEAVRLMDEFRIRHVVVTDLPGIGFGIVSIRDFAGIELASFEKEIAFEHHVWSAI